MDEIIAQSLKESIAAKQALVSHQKDDIKLLAEWMVAAIRGGNKILIFGNGGSAADAQHMAAEFINRFLINRRPLPAIALTTDTSVLTSIGNDFSFDDIFLKQVQALGREGDIALGISTSGNSPNVLKAVAEAKRMGMKTAALTGGKGGKLVDLADLCLNVPVGRTPAVQEAHIWVEHLLCLLIDEALFGKSA